MNKSYYVQGKRYAECIGCGKTWNIALNQKLPRNGYECPNCYHKRIKMKGKEKDEG